MQCCQCVYRLYSLQQHWFCFLAWCPCTECFWGVYSLGGIQSACNCLTSATLWDVLAAKLYGSPMGKSFLDSSPTQNSAFVWIEEGRQTCRCYTISDMPCPEQPMSVWFGLAMVWVRGVDLETAEPSIITHSLKLRSSTRLVHCRRGHAL
jgi:hypothetical protein